MEKGKNLSQPLLEISLLGRFRVKVDGVTVDEKRWGRKSPKSLVKLLALKPSHALHREQVMDLLWAEESPETAVNNLNKAIHAARRAFEPELKKGSHSRFLLTSQEQIILASPGELQIDLDAFEQRANYAIRHDDLAAGKEAIGLYKGDLLTEDVFEDWVYTRRESLRILFRKAATKTAEMQAANGEQTASVELWQRLIAEDATDEYVHRLLMRAHAEAGSKYQALKQFELCRTALNSLGVEPEDETLQLDERIKRGEILPVKERLRTSVSNASVLAPPVIKQLSFRNGAIRSARFMSDGKTIILSAAWDGAASQLFTLNVETGEIRSLGKENSVVYSISNKGKIAAGFDAELEGYLTRGKLVTFDRDESCVREIAETVQCADWHPSADSRDERNLAIVRDRSGNSSLELPIGNVIFKTSGWLSHPRFSPDGKKIAFIEHPLNYDDRGHIVLLDLDSKKPARVLTEISITILGLAWRDGEIWFTGAHEGGARMVRAVSQTGDERPVYRGTGSLTLQDVSPGGEALVTDYKMRVQASVFRATDGAERDFSWHDWTLVRDLTDDGETLLFEEAGISGGNDLSTYVRKTDGTSIRKIGDGSAFKISPDGGHVLMRFNWPYQHLALVPIGEGETSILSHDPDNPLNYQVFANFFPDGKRIIFTAHSSNGATRIFTQLLNGDRPVLFPTDENLRLMSGYPFSPDGRSVILTDSGNRLVRCRTSDGKSSRLENLESGFWLVRWAGDGEHIFVRRRDGVPAVVYRYNLASGKKERWLELSPPDKTGVFQISSISLTPDGRNYAYSYSRESSDLFLMSNLR